ncbi:calcium-binding protein [Phormidium nigroviride]
MASVIVANTGKGEIMSNTLSSEDIFNQLLSEIESGEDDFEEETSDEEDDDSSSDSIPGAFFSTDTDFNNISGTGGNDTLNGESTNDTLSGLAGDDRINGGGGADLLVGGLGDDIYTLPLTSGGTRIQDEGGGNDELNFIGEIKLETSLTVGKVGMARNNTSLVVDINKDGKYEADRDLTVENFFANESKNQPGSGAMDFIAQYDIFELMALVNPIATTLTPTPSPISTPTPSPVSTSTPTPVSTSTSNPTPTPVSTSTPNPTPTPVSTSTANPTPTPLATSTPNPTPTPSPTPLATSTPNPTPTPSPTLLVTSTSTSTETIRINFFTGSQTPPNTDPSGIPEFQVKQLESETLFSLSDKDDNIFLASYPEAANKSIQALNGSDNVRGTDLNDNINGNKGNDTIEGGSGDDTLRGGKDYDRLFGNTGNDIVNGGNEDDSLYGGVDDDILRGGKGKDLLFGEEGNDLLVGDFDQDSLVGGAGSDLFVLQSRKKDSSSDTSTNPAEVDIVADFQLTDGDKIGLVGLANNALSFESIQIQVNEGTSESATAIKIKASGEYLGIVKGVAANDMAAQPSNYFLDVSNNQKLTLG